MGLFATGPSSSGAAHPFSAGRFQKSLKGQSSGPPISSNARLQARQPQLPNHIAARGLQTRLPGAMLLQADTPLLPLDAAQESGARRGAWSTFYFVGLTRNLRQRLPRSTPQTVPSVAGSRSPSAGGLSTRSRCVAGASRGPIGFTRRLRSVRVAAHSQAPKAVRNWMSNGGFAANAAHSISVMRMPPSI
jgi:hypothetical protein